MYGERGAGRRHHMAIPQKHYRHREHKIISWGEGTDIYLSVRPAFETMFAGDLLHNGGADFHFSGRFFYGKMEVPHQVFECQLPSSLPLCYSLHECIQRNKLTTQKYINRFESSPVLNSILDRTVQNLDRRKCEPRTRSTEVLGKTACLKVPLEFNHMFRSHAFNFC